MFPVSLRYSPGWNSGPGQGHEPPRAKVLKPGTGNRVGQKGRDSPIVVVNAKIKCETESPQVAPRRRFDNLRQHLIGM
jgi:hypothetical protein